MDKKDIRSYEKVFFNSGKEWNDIYNYIIPLWLMKNGIENTLSQLYKNQNNTKFNPKKRTANLSKGAVKRIRYQLLEYYLMQVMKNKKIKKEKLIGYFKEALVDNNDTKKIKKEINACMKKFKNHL